MRARRSFSKQRVPAVNRPCLRYSHCTFGTSYKADAAQRLEASPQPAPVVDRGAAAGPPFVVGCLSIQFSKNRRYAPFPQGRSSIVAGCQEAVNPLPALFESGFLVFFGFPAAHRGGGPGSPAQVVFGRIKGHGRRERHEECE